VKKTLFSLTFVAASGVYVATAGHLFSPANDANMAPATDTALRAVAPLPIKPTASTLPLIASSQFVQPEVPQVTARVASRQTTLLKKSTQVPAQMTSPPIIAPVMGTPRTVAEVVPAPVSPLPLPRPRPVPPAPVAIQPAASTNATATSRTSGYADGTYKGGDENAYYGRVQVQITVINHQIASVRVLDYPQDRRTSRYINSQALPRLKQEMIAAQSANIDTVSGATLTSEAYIKSLGSALAQAGGARA
jgi:uncharacterized protein with FMN-binding domain